MSMSRSYAAQELRNVSGSAMVAGAANGNPLRNAPARSSSQERNNDFDVGYDTDSIAIFEIDKAFTDYLLCQICFSK